MSAILDAFRGAEALLEGHFLLSSGLHSPRYLQCALVLQNPVLAADLCNELRRRWTGPMPTVVIGPALGGVTLAYELARAFGVRGLFAERDAGKFTLRRGFRLSQDDHVLVAEDVVTTGGSVQEVLDLVRSLGATPIGVMSLIQRCDENPFAVPYVALEKVQPPVYQSGDCPLCKSGSVAVKPGSRPGAAAADRSAAR